SGRTTRDSSRMERRHRLQHLCRLACRIRIEVHHRAALVAIDDAYDWAFIGFAERETTSHPFVLLEGNRSLGCNQDVRSESSDVWALRREPTDLAHRGGGNHGDARFVEDAAVQVQHLDRRTMAATNLRRQFAAEHLQL